MTAVDVLAPTPTRHDCPLEICCEGGFRDLTDTKFGVEHIFPTANAALEDEDDPPSPPPSS